MRAIAVSVFMLLFLIFVERWQGFNYAVLLGLACIYGRSDRRP